MANAGKDKIQEYKESLKLKAEQLIMTGFPEKIELLNDILESPQWNEKDLDNVHQVNIPMPEPLTFNYIGDVSPPERAKMEKCPVDCNKTLMTLIKTVKPHIKQLIEDADLLKMWISLMIPKIEDGNNFGVSVLEETVDEIQSVESNTVSLFDKISQYFCTRAKLISKVTKYPHVDDYRQAVRELDEKEYKEMRLVMCQTRNHYSSLHDTVVKNLETIKNPRSTNSQSLY